MTLQEVFGLLQATDINSKQVCLRFHTSRDLTMDQYLQFDSTVFGYNADMDTIKGINSIGIYLPLKLCTQVTFDWLKARFIDAGIAKNLRVPDTSLDITAFDLDYIWFDKDDNRICINCYTSEAKQ